MSWYPFASLLTGSLLLIAGVMTLIRNILLDPVSPNYPKAPVVLRNCMFGFAAVLIFLGLQFLWTFASGKPSTIPPQPSPSMQFLALALFIYKGAMLGNILRQRYPEQIWEKLNRINDRMTCENCRNHPLWQWLSR